MPGSVNVAVAVATWVIGSKVTMTIPTVGATLLTVTVPVYSVTPLSLSRILPLTERVPLSSVGQVALAVAPKAP